MGGIESTMVSEMGNSYAKAENPDHNHPQLVILK